jgi:hypothetical protein
MQGKHGNGHNNAAKTRPSKRHADPNSGFPALN